MKKYILRLKKLYRENPGQFWAGFILLFILMLISTNRLFDLKVSDLLKEDGRQKFIQRVLKYRPQSSFRLDEKFRNQVIRRSVLDPNRKFTLNLLYLNGEEIARFKSNGDNIYDVEGNIPNGKIKFFSETDQRFGDEVFKQSVRHGEYHEFYKDGQKYRDAKFSQGKPISNKVYYIDGIIRMEEDRSDALRLVDDREAGAGKIYFRDGKVMYEWSLTNKGHGGYKKSYNQLGQLTEVKKYDQNGKMISAERLRR